MYYECLLWLTLLSLVLPAQLYDDESCSSDIDGECMLLSKCAPLLSEIRQAGNPMPAHLRRKLQSLGCGFEYSEPLVCCKLSYANTNGGHSQGNHFDNTPSFRPTSQWYPNQESNPSSSSDFNNRGNKNGAFGSNSIEQVPDIQDHPNLRLLPRSCGTIESERIIGGNRTRLYEMPWMVILVYESARGLKLSCGGTLITEWYVLTAAHCVSFLGGRLKLRSVILGEYDIRTNPDCERQEGELLCAPSSRNVSVDVVTAHPGYNPQKLADDIALIRLAEPADFTLDIMKPICLPITRELQRENLDRQQGIVAGWGATEEGLQSPVLLSVALPIITNNECQEIYKGSPQIYDKQLCAGGIEGKDSCGGDSGGPLMVSGRVDNGGVRYVQRGVVSYGSKRCGLDGFPGVYTRVGNYMDWILDNIS